MQSGNEINKTSDKIFRYKLTKPVFFIGFMGAGKTSVARRVARMCSVSSVDMDTYIERSTEKKINQIFAEEGEGCFRDIESKTLFELASQEPLLISCGGGIVQQEVNRSILAQKGFVIYLEVSVAEAAERINEVSTRPLFSSLENAYQINQARLPFYEELADAKIDTAGKEIGTIAQEVEAILRKEGILWQIPELL